MPMSEYMRSLRDKVGIAVRSETGERTPRPDGDETLEVRYFVRSELSGIYCKPPSDEQIAPDSRRQ